MAYGRRKNGFIPNYAWLSNISSSNVQGIRDNAAPAAMRILERWGPSVDRFSPGVIKRALSALTPNPWGSIGRPANPQHAMRMRAYYEEKLGLKSSGLGLVNNMRK